MKLLHALAFQAVWFACVLGAAAGSSLPGLGAGALFLALTLVNSSRPLQELRFVAQVTLLGVTFDSVLGLSGVLAFAAPLPSLPGLAPLWLAVLWASFATLAPRSLSWLQARLPLAIGLGVLAGPLTYFSATRLGAAELLTSAPLAAALVAAEYGVALPLILRASRPLSADPAPRETLQEEA